MNRDHRILPRAPAPHSHLHRPAVLGALLFLCLFILFAGLVLNARLNPNKLSGYASNASVGARVNITNSSSFTCTHAFQTGTNLVSFPCIPLSLSMEDFLANMSQDGANIGAIYAYTPLTDGKWTVYNESLPSYAVQSLSAFSQQKGYYFVMGAPETFSYYGYLASKVTITLRKGWNLVGYPRKDVRNLSDIFQSINTTYVIIETLEGVEENGTYLTDTPPPGGETLTNTSPYHGYWINVTSSDIWQVSP